jgi:hypothetical protein
MSRNNYAIENEEQLAMLKQPLPFISSDINFLIDNLLKEINVLLNMSRLKEALEKMATVQ